MYAHTQSLKTSPEFPFDADSSEAVQPMVVAGGLLEDGDESLMFPDPPGRLAKIEGKFERGCPTTTRRQERWKSRAPLAARHFTWEDRSGTDVFAPAGGQSLLTSRFLQFARSEAGGCLAWKKQGPTDDRFQDGAGTFMKCFIDVRRGGPTARRRSVNLIWSSTSSMKTRIAR